MATPHDPPKTAGSPSRNGPLAATPGLNAAAGARKFGRFSLLQLLGKSDRSMVWRVHDPRSDQELMLTMPRTQPADAAALEDWLRDARLAARLNHPQLAAVVDIGAHEHWPYVASDRALGVTLVEWLQQHPRPQPADVARWVGQALEGLAFAHEAGVAHRDLQTHLLIVNEAGRVRLLGLGVVGMAVPVAELSGAHRLAQNRSIGLSVDLADLKARRDAAEHDVLAMGVVLHSLLAGAAALDETDTARVIARMTPLGRETLRLPHMTPQPVPETLRIIVNRATSPSVGQRYRNARSLLRAIDGWREADEREGGGPVGQLLDRVNINGHLPALPGVAQRAARLALMEKGRTTEMAELILQDIALSFEMLRNVNSAHVQGTQVSGNGPVLTVRRAVLMLGLDGIRNAAAGLRVWPGPLADKAAAALQHLMERVQLAGHLAQAVRPRGFDREVVFLIAALQNLGRLVVCYHFPEEAVQIQQLMHPAPPERATDTEPVPMSEEAASLAVLGADIDTLGAAVARQWGLNDEVLHMIRRLPLLAPVRNADRDDDVLRATGSCANEVADVLNLPVARQAAALEHVAQRYARSLGHTLRDLQEALQRARHKPMDFDDTGMDTAGMRLDTSAAWPTDLAGPAQPAQDR